MKARTARIVFASLLSVVIAMAFALAMTGCQAPPTTQPTMGTPDQAALASLDVQQGILDTAGLGADLAYAAGKLGPKTYAVINAGIADAQNAIDTARTAAEAGQSLTSAQRLQVVRNLVQTVVQAIRANNLHPPAVTPSTSSASALRFGPE
jgi:hypothetical protein